MNNLSGFWHAAARLSGRIDFSTWVDADGTCPDLDQLSSEALAAGGLAPTHLAHLGQMPPLEAAGPHLKLGQPGFPSHLAPVPHAPAVLFYQGNITLLGQPSVAIVGSRKCTAWGAQLAGQLARAVRNTGGTVVSGLAHGIDTAAHRSALDRTIAVLGQGLGIPLPRSQQRLADEIVAAGGLIVSEFLPRRTATRYTFPQRNRVIAGLSSHTVIVEARARSGALITAEAALTAGREVLAVPGHPLDDHHDGCLSLLADGAGLVRGPGDLLQAIGSHWAVKPPQAHGPASSFIRALTRGATVDQLIRASGASSASVARTLAALELNGEVERLAGDRYSLRSST